MLSESTWNKLNTILSYFLNKKYDSVSVVTANADSQSATFPTVEIQLASSISVGMDLEHSAEDSANISFMLNVYSDNSLLEARTILNDSLDILFRYGFNVVNGPLEAESSVPRMTATVRKIVSKDDTLF